MQLTWCSCVQVRCVTDLVFSLRSKVNEIDLMFLFKSVVCVIDLVFVFKVRCA